MKLVDKKTRSGHTEVLTLGSNRARHAARKTGPEGTEILALHSTRVRRAEKKTGPEGTEILVRQGLPARKHAGRSGPAVSRPLENTAYYFRHLVEEARREGLPDKIESARHRRQQFWLNTCREVFEMRAASGQVLELHRQHGCRFCVPTPKQVQHILDALDVALPGWDRDHASLFYRTLELNFPELLRVHRDLRKGGIIATP